MLSKLNIAMDYIEKNLEEPLSTKSIARCIAVPEYLLNNIFLAVTGSTLSEYIRERRFSEANKALLAGKSVTELAFKYGYNSVEGFSRAFKKWSGVLPSEAARKKQLLISPKYTFIATAVRSEPLQCNIISMNTLYFTGISKELPLVMQNRNEPGEAMVRSITDKTAEKLLSLPDLVMNDFVYGYQSSASLKYGKPVPHYYGVLTKTASDKAEFNRFEIPAAEWAIFSISGAFPDVTVDLWRRVYGEWFLYSGYYPTNSFCFGITRFEDSAMKRAYHEIWMPVSHIPSDTDTNPKFQE